MCWAANLGSDHDEQSTVGGTASDSPVMQGRNARENGHGRDSCPYPEGSAERQGWFDGYDNVTADVLEAGLRPRGG